MCEPSEPQHGIVLPDSQRVKAVVDLFVPVARKFTLNYHGAEEPLGHEYSVTLEVDTDQIDSFLPMKLIIGSVDSADLIGRCIQVLKAGYIRARGELVIDHHGRNGTQSCSHLMDVTWFEAAFPLVDNAEVTGAG
ncbi:MAG: hypothetical protein BZY87_07500 [SAR202 cluster bacterium Io17-Chloro-G6]|nr:MAG: hypothetical protein BZY87_07500 [SAR202 cluster bacterium Io17-Chloro-G6]